MVKIVKIQRWKHKQKRISFAFLFLISWEVGVITHTHIGYNANWYSQHNLVTSSADYTADNLLVVFFSLFAITMKPVDYIVIVWYIWLISFRLYHRTVSPLRLHQYPLCLVNSFLHFISCFVFHQYHQQVRNFFLSNYAIGMSINAIWWKGINMCGNYKYILNARWMALLSKGTLNLCKLPFHAFRYAWSFAFYDISFERTFHIPHGIVNNDTSLWCKKIMRWRMGIHWKWIVLLLANYFLFFSISMAHSSVTVVK